MKTIVLFVFEDCKNTPKLKFNYNYQGILIYIFTYFLYDTVSKKYLQLEEFYLNLDHFYPIHKKNKTTI